MKQGQNQPPLYLYILPNGPFNPELQDAAYIFNLQIRNLEFTSIVEEEEGTFLYTKFDCFHCVLPLIDCSKCFENVLVSGQITIPSEEQRKCQFPQVLLRRNLDEAVQLIKHIISQLPHSQLDRHCKVFISQAPSICRKYSQSIQWKNTENVEVPSETPYQFNECGRHDSRELIEKAAEASPLKTVRVGQTIQNKENAQLKKQNCKLQGELDKKKQELKTVRKDLEQEKQQRKEAQEAVERLTRELSHLHLVEPAQEKDIVIVKEPMQETNTHASSKLVSGDIDIDPMHI